ncbi:MAG: EF-P lysine aminoacylase EpmA [Alphaproteobacteria bacterium]|nr:EF-P lysine aminoacylase EpmA [Alphaproteobacteria bacterium]
MSWWLSHNFEKKRKNLEKRAKIFKALRGFLDGRGYTEVQTPALQVCPVMDVHIHGFATRFENKATGTSQDLYLHTSPEFDMKKLLVAGMETIYSLGPVFRNGDYSASHRPEFTLLEWYRVGEDYTYLMDESVDMLQEVVKALGGVTYTHKGIKCNPFLGAQKISVVEAFETYADMDLYRAMDDIEDFRKMADKRGIRIAGTDDWEDIFHAVMGERIEPFLGREVPTILYDYPVSLASLSRKKPDDPQFAERFELYVCGMELANAYSELCDAKEQRMRYETEMALKKKIYGETYPPDEAFFKALEHGMPECAGIALGVDRLVMLACGVEDMEDVHWAPVPIKN